MIPLSRTTIHTEHALRMLGTLILGILFVAYGYYQARNLIQGPSITLTNIPNRVTNERAFTLTGTARNIVSLTLNGKPIYTNEQGDFTHILILESGATIMTLTAEDRYGRTTSIHETLVYTGSLGV